MSNKEIMELLLLTQYFDMVKDVGQASKSSTLFMTHSPSAVNKVRLDNMTIDRTTSNEHHADSSLCAWVDNACAIINSVNALCGASN